MLIDWTDQILIGLPDLDDEHRRLVAGINDVGCALQDGRPDAAELMGAWIELFRVHARREENLLARLALPAGRSHGLDHGAGHRNFLNRANLCLDRLRGGEFCGDALARLGDHLMLTEVIRHDFEMIGHLRREGLLLPDGSLRAAE